MNALEMRNEFASRLAEPFPAELLFDHLDHLTYFVKDELGRYMALNQTLALRCGHRDKSTLIGRTAAEVFAPSLGNYFLKQDLELIRSGRPLINELEQHPYPKRINGWCLTTKLPLLDKSGFTIGLIGMSRDLQSPDQDTNAYESVAKVIDRVRSSLDQSIRTSELAELAGLSVWQLDQRIKDLFALTTGQLILQLRMDDAAKALLQTDLSVIQVALRVGYADQSAFLAAISKNVWDDTYRISPRIPRGLMVSQALSPRTLTSRPKAYGTANDGPSCRAVAGY